MRPRSRQHLEKAERNYQFATPLAGHSGSPAAELEWAVIAAFYASVHYVNAVLFELLGFVPSRHEDRELAMSRVAALRPVMRDYMHLQREGWEARYSVTYITSLPDVQHLIGQPLARIRAQALRSLAERR